MEEKSFYKELGEHYRVLRLESGLSQLEAAEKAGIKSSQLSAFEVNGERLSAWRIALLFNAVGVDLFKKKQTLG